MQNTSHPVMADFAGHRGDDPARRPRTRHRNHRLRRPVARPDQRSLDEGGRRARRLPGLQPALPGRNVDANLALVDADDLAAIERAVPRDAAAGARYPERAMADLDSER
jgi:hypothetical protein